jgi:hypothetical protein
MNVGTDLVAAEAALLAILLLLGSGPAALLPARFDAAPRIALAPILGFCLGTCVTTTLLEFFAAAETYLVLVGLGLASGAVAVTSAVRSRPVGRPSLRDVAQLLVVCVVVTGPLSAVLHARHTLGPAAYYFTDVDSYVATQQGAQTTSLRDAREAWNESQRDGTRFADLTQYNYAFLADFGANLDAAPLHASVNELLGLSPIDTFSPFLIVLLLAGGLGAFAVVRHVAGVPTWTAVLAGAVFTGPLFLELWFDTHQAAIIALGLLLPTVLLGSEALHDPRPRNLALAALMLATFVTVYPLFVPPLAVVGGAAMVVAAIALRRRGAPGRELLRSLALPAVAVTVLAAAFNPVAVARTVGYYASVLGSDFPFPRVGYTLPPDVLPGWLLQTREFWFLTPFGPSGAKEILLGVLIPLVFMLFAGVAVVRQRFALALLGLGCVFALMAYVAYRSADSCTYCGQRYLLALAPILAALIALGLSQLARRGSRLWAVVAVAGALLVVAAVGQRTRVELDRFADVSFFFDTANRSALEELPRDRRPVHVEGYFASAAAQAEQPLVYHLVTDRARGRASISLGTNVFNAVAYLTFGNVLRPGPEFRSDYRYLLTRFSGVSTDRRLIARRGAVSVMERTRPLDVTPYAGLAIEMARLNGSGVPWVLPGTPLQLHVVGEEDGPVWARLTFATSERIVVLKQPGVRARAAARALTVCVRAKGAAPLRDVTVTVPAPAPGAVRLTGMRAVSGRCRL